MRPPAVPERKEITTTEADTPPDSAAPVLAEPVLPEPAGPVLKQDGEAWTCVHDRIHYRIRRTPGGTVVIDKPYPVPYTAPDLDSARVAIARGLPPKRTTCKTEACFRWPSWRTGYLDTNGQSDEIYTCDGHLAHELAALAAAGLHAQEPEAAPEPTDGEGPYKQVLAHTPYPAVAPPATERAGVLQMRSMVECVRCEQRSGWSFGGMPRTWPATHAATEHPDVLSPWFRLWQLMRFDVWVKPEAPLAHTPQAPPPGQPAAFALSECRTCGDSSDWRLTPVAGDEEEGLRHWEDKHRRNSHTKKDVPAFDRWHLTREHGGNQ